MNKDMIKQSLEDIKMAQEAMESAILRRSRGLVMIYAMQDLEALEYQEATRMFHDNIRKIEKELEH